MLWILYRTTNGKTEFLGVYPDEKIAKKDIEVMSRVDPDEWQLASVLMVGWNALTNNPLMAGEVLQ